MLRAKKLEIFDVITLGVTLLTVSGVEEQNVRKWRNTYIFPNVSASIRTSIPTQRVV